MTRAVYAGSFDPITNGHLWMVAQGAHLFDSLVVAIGINPEKSYSFSLEERLTMLRRAVRRFPNVTIDSYVNQYLVNYADAVKADYILRGIRSQGDYEYERGFRNINSDLNTDVDTVFLMPPREIAEVSSSMIRSMVGYEGWEVILERYVPPSVYNLFLLQHKGMRKRWLALWEKAGGRLDGEGVYKELLSRYGGEHRVYHNMVHVARALSDMDSIRGELERPDEVELALWFHDVVYEPGSRGNEEKSASLARERLESGGLGGEVAVRVAELIMATDFGAGTGSPDGVDQQYLRDIDLAVLGRPRKEFEEYERDIREEFGALSPEEYRAGRSAFLRSLLDWPHLYGTKFFRDRLEERARENIEESLRHLA